MTQYLPTYVRAPVVTPLPYGLLSVVQTPTDDADKRHWRNGIQFQGDPCDAAQTTQDPCPSPSAGFVKPPTADGLPAKGAESFTVYAYLPCNPVGYYQTAEQRILNHFTMGEARAVERTFWTGIIDAPVTGITYPHLAADTEVASDGLSPVLLQTAADVVVTGVVDIVEGIGLLESALGTCFGGVGVIHAPRAAFAHMSANHLIYTRGGTAYTLADTPIAFGAGYPGTSPAGDTPAFGNVWLYATGPIMMRRDPEIKITATPAESLDRSVNTLNMIAERTYNLAWDCCHFAVQVSLGGIVTGTAGSAT